MENLRGSFSVFLAVLPVLTCVVLYAAHNVDQKASLIFAAAFAVVAAALGWAADRFPMGLLYAVLFMGAYAFSALLRIQLHAASRAQNAVKVELKDKLAEKKASHDKSISKLILLSLQLDRIVKRYAFARTLVVHTEERPILQDFAALFSSEKIMLGMTFCLAEEPGGPELPERKIMPRKPLLVSGSVPDSDWTKILRNLRFESHASHGRVLVYEGAERNRTAVAGEDLGIVPLPPHFLSVPAQGLPINLVFVPLVWSKGIQGFLAFLLKGDPTVDFLSYLPEYSKLLGLGLYKTSLYRMVLERSRMDGLTNLYLRRIFMERLNVEINTSKRYGTSFSLMMLDLDNFKSVNDTYGHQAGDKVLKTVADSLKATLHPGVMICRYGGEEFAVLIGLAPTNEILETAERVRTTIAAIPINLFGEVKIRITLSIGVSHYLPDTPSAEELIRRADEALYIAKEAGRNCVREWKS